MTLARNVLDYWTTVDGTDYYPALQRAIDAAQQGAPARVYIPGFLSLSQEALITRPVHVFGDCFGASGLVPSPANNCIVVDTVLPVKLTDFAISYPSAAASTTVGITIKCTDTTGNGLYGNSSSVLRDLQIVNANISIGINQAQAYVIDNVKSLLHGLIGIVAQNTNYPDAGDGKIEKCFILGRSLTGTLAGIQWTGGGGCSILNNKILTCQYGVLAQLQAGAVTRQLSIQNNSMDGCSISAASFWPLGSVPVPFGGVVIDGNIFNLCHYGISAPLPPIGKWISTMTVGQNNWYPDSPGGVYLDASAVTSLNPGYADMTVG